MNYIETMKQALEVLEQLTQGVMYGGVQNNLRAAIDEAEKQEPVAWKPITDAQWVNIVNHKHAWDGYKASDAVEEAFKMIEAKCKENNTHPAPTKPDSEQAKDAARLDALDRLGFSYGFEDMHEGNRWCIEGPFATVRAAIDAAMKVGAGGTAVES